MHLQGRGKGRGSLKHFKDVKVTTFVPKVQQDNLRIERFVFDLSVNNSVAQHSNSNSNANANNNSNYNTPLNKVLLVYVRRRSADVNKRKRGLYLVVACND